MTDIPEHVQAAAEWWEAYSKPYWPNRRVLIDWCQEHGPITTKSGKKIGMLADGNSWDSDGVHSVMPDLIKNAKLEFEGAIAEAERILSLVLEEVPTIQWKVARTVDARLANGIIRAGGPAAEKILPFRTSKTKLGIV